MITILHDQPAYLVVRASGVLTHKDYEAATAELEAAMRLADHPIRALILLEDFRGWQLDALGDELGFDMKHRNDFARIAVVGESRMQEWGTRLSKLLFNAEMRYFPRDRRSDAEAWLSGP